jgi:hypothetical protein
MDAIHDAHMMPEAPQRKVRTPEETRRNRRLRLPVLALGLSFFGLAIYGGLWRLGFNLPHGENLAGQHGPLMIGGFFGTLIGLERGVALGRLWVFAAPALSCLAGLTILAGAPMVVSAILFACASAILTAASLSVMRDDRQLFTAVLAGGAACWAIGNLVWLVTADVPAATVWWLLFLVLTIAAERLDMSRLLGIGRTGRIGFLVCTGLLVAGASLGLFNAWGAALLRLGLVSLSLWLARHDIAFRNLRRAPHLRFFGICMSAGYVWMGVAGAVLLLAPPAVAPFGYDLVLHAILIGFVLSMALGHSVIVIPAITGAQAPYHPAMYVGLGLLHASVAIRACADLLAWLPGRIISGPLSLLGLLAFGVVLARQIRGAMAARRRA